MPCVGTDAVGHSKGEREGELVAYLPHGGSRKPVYLPHHAQQRQKLFVLVVKAVPKDDRVNDVGD